MSDRSEADCVSNDLVERVVRAICEIENGPCKCMPDECGCTYWKAHARAAIAVALEEAAKVAENASFQFTQTTPSTVEVVDVRHTIAAAIRALVKETA